MVISQYKFAVQSYVFQKFNRYFLDSGRSEECNALYNDVFFSEITFR